MRVGDSLSSGNNAAYDMIYNSNYELGPNELARNCNFDRLSFLACVAASNNDEIKYKICVDTTCENSFALIFLANFFWE